MTEWALPGTGGRLGATYLGDGRTAFSVWASRRETVDVALGDRRHPLPARGQGYFAGVVDDVEPGARYRYRLDGEVELADPASRWQPDGVHGPSAVVDPEFPWSDGDWHGLPLRDHVLYELHVGTFTPEGTFDAAVGHLDDLAELGVTAVEVMPVAQFPGGRNWGYDGVLPYAAQDSYGGPDGFRRLVDACHRRGLAVVLDVVYNHFGPEGGVHGEFGHYFTDRYDTPWGPALNFDDAHSDHVRRYFVENALWWVDDCHVDGLRLDAVHAIHDRSAVHFLEELASAVQERGERMNRRVHVIAESDLNDPRLVRPREVGGYGLDAQWTDDFHHALHAVLTGEEQGYYTDFGAVSALGAAVRDGFVFTGQWSEYRQRRHGAPPSGVPGQRFVVCAQNHDQIGNRMQGERLTTLVDVPLLEVAATCLLLSPFVPLLFMGEEYGETAPFLYFVSHTDDDLVTAVRAGRKQEFASFEWPGEPPDPQSEETYLRSRLDHDLKQKEPHRRLLDLHRRLLDLRANVPALASLDRGRLQVAADDSRRTLVWRRWSRGGDEAAVAANFGEHPAEPPVPDATDGRWERVLCTPDATPPDTLRAADGLAIPVAGRSASVYVRRDHDEE